MEDGHRITNEIVQASVAFELGLDPKEVNIKSFNVTGGSNKGDGYACIMKAIDLVAEVKGEDKEMCYMAKCKPMNEFRAEMLTKGDIFNVEITMYTKILPALRKLDPRLSAPMVFYADEKAGVIVMEDLKKQGYYLADIKQELGLPNVKLILEQLAILHASSYHFIETYPSHSSFKQDFPMLSTEHGKLDDCNEFAKPFMDFISQLGQVLISTVEEYCPDKSQLVHKLKDFALRRSTTLSSLQKPQGNFNCILHHDAHANNFLFRNNNEGNVDKVKILDLQLSRRARPMVDIAYFFGTSTSPELRKAHLDELLSFYHKTLIQSLTSFGHDSSVYSYDQLKKDFTECYSFGFVMSQMTAMMKLTPADNKEASFDIDEAKDDEEFAKISARFKEAQKKQIRENEALRNRLILIALEAEEMGII